MNTIANANTDLKFSPIAGQNSQTGRYNPDLLALIPPDARTIIDVGCGAGALAAAYRPTNPYARWFGIERDPSLAAAARLQLYEVASVDVELDPLPFRSIESPDCIIYGDVLQHLRDPQAVLRRHLEILAPRGFVLICIPNAEHWTFAHRLFHNKWSYEAAGLLDRGHLRLFTLRSIKQELATAGLVVEDHSCRIFNPAIAQEFIRSLSAALRALNIDPQDYAERATPLQYVLKARRRSDDTAAPASVAALLGAERGAGETEKMAPTDVRQEFPHAGEPTSVKPAVTAENPPFCATYPEIFNADLIPNFSRHSMEVAWKQESFEAQPLNLYRVDEGFVAHEALIFDRDLRVLPSSTHAFSQHDIRGSVAALRDALDAGRIASFPTPAVVVRARATNNYGHYLAEMFPKAFMAQRLINDRPLNFLVHRSSARTLDVVYQSLSLIGIGLDRIIITGNEPAHFRQIIALEGMTRHGSYMSPLVVESLEAMASSIKPASTERLFVLRSGGRKRRLLNEEELIPILERAGYLAVDTSSMSLRDQIALFAGAKQVIGVLGAAMTNIVFCPRGTKVAILAPCIYPDTFFWFLAAHKKHRYVEVRCEQQQNGGAESWNAGFLVRQREIDFLLSL